MCVSACDSPLSLQCSLFHAGRRRSLSLREQAMLLTDNPLFVPFRCDCCAVGQNTVHHCVIQCQNVIADTAVATRDSLINRQTSAARPQTIKGPTTTEVTRSKIMQRHFGLPSSNWYLPAERNACPIHAVFSCAISISRNNRCERMPETVHMFWW